jgi:hypothetical protein
MVSYGVGAWCIGFALAFKWVTFVRVLERST